MDLPLIIFVSLLVLLTLGGAGGLFLFQLTSRHRPAKFETREDPNETDSLMLSDLELQANALAGLVAELPEVSTPPGMLSLLRARMGDLAHSAPRSAVMKAWRELENSTLQTLSLYDYGEFPVTRLRSLEMMALLKDNGALEEGHFEICRGLDDIRNMVFGMTNLQVGEDVASAVVDAAEQVSLRLSVFRETFTPRPQT